MARTYPIGSYVQSPFVVMERVEVNVQKAIPASADQLWAYIGGFSSLASWAPGVSLSEIVEGDDNTVGAVRKLTLENGFSFCERCEIFESSERRNGYTILDNAMNLFDYHAILQALPGDGDNQATLSWTTKFETPADNKEQATAQINALFTSCADAVAHHFASAN